MRKTIALLLVILLVFNLSGCGIESKAKERFYLCRKPAKAIEHFFGVELPRDTEILEYAYEYARLLDHDDNIYNNNTTITAKLSIPAKDWNAFAEGMDAAGYQSLNADTDEAKEASEFYDHSDRKYAQEKSLWWNFDRADAEGYYGWYVSGYVKHVSTPYLFAIPNGDFVTVFLLLIV